MTDTPTGRPLPPSRYGRAQRPPEKRRRLAVILGALATLALVGVAALLYHRFEGKDILGKATGYVVVDDQTVSVTISVTRKDPAVPVVCIVRARSKDGAETGRREVFVGPSDAATVQVTTTVRAYERPFVGDIYGCGTTIPRYLAPA